jgi:hypothetical protein
MLKNSPKRPKEAKFGFSEFDFYDLYRSTFEKSELGRMKRLLPLHEMAESFGLTCKSMRPIVRGKERQAVQRAQGEGLCKAGTCKGQGDSDGGLVRNAERALRPEAGQGQD